MQKKRFSFPKISEFLTTFFASKRLLEMLWKVDKWLFLGSLITVSIPAIVPFINAYIYKLLIDLVVSAINTGVVPYERLYLLLVTRVLTLFVQDIAFAAQNYFDILIWTKFPIHLYQTVLTKLSSLDVQYFEDSTFKDRLEKVKDTYVWRPFNMLTNLFYGFQSGLQFFIALFALATFNWVYVLLVLLITIPSFIDQTKYAKIAWGIWHDNSPYRKRFNYISDLLQGNYSVKEVKLFGLSSRFLSELKDLYRKFLRDNTKIAQKQLRSNIFFKLFGGGIYMGIEVSVFFAAVVRRISIGDISYITSVLNNFHNSVDGLFRNATRVFDQSLYIQEMFALLDIEPKITQPKNAIKVDTYKAPRIEFKNVSFTYPGSEHKVLNNFSIVIDPGHKVAFVGENGAGKTTIVKLLARFYDVDEGEILINGINIKNLDLPTWYDVLGVLFQDFLRYEFTLKENIFFGKAHNQEVMAEIIDAAESSGANEVAEGLPNGYEQILGKTFEGGIELSVGQWQKVALARAFYRNAPILILDEPTASIDAKAESEIFDKVKKLARDKTVLIISHRFSTVRNADKIYVIHKGKIKEEGSHEQLMKKDGMYATLFNLQAEGYK